MRTTRIAALAVVAMLVAACGAAATPAPSAAPTSAATEAATVAPTPDACATANLTTLTAGRLTIGTDNPAYSPYFLPKDGGNTPPWDTEYSGDPTTGTGFESAVAYAVAKQLGFAADKVDWTPVKFDNSYAPGPKPFDFYLAQVSYKPERAQTADLSDGYYFVTQAVVALSGKPIASAKSVADLKGYQFGAQAGTTSYDTITNVIAPTKDAKVYDSNDTAITALKAGLIDGIVVDLPTAFYMTAVQLDNGVIVGQFASAAGADQEHYSLVLAKGSPLTACVNQALAALKADGTLAAITKEWMSDKANAPVFTP